MVVNLTICPRGVVLYLSPSNVLKRNFLAVDVTLDLAHPPNKSWMFKCLYVPEAIEWE